MILSLRRFVKSRTIRAARKAYDEAKAKHEDAVKRRDTRDKHLTAEALTKAATALLQAETVRVIRR